MLLIYLIERKWKKNNKKTKWREKKYISKLIYKIDQEVTF